MQRILVIVTVIAALGSAFVLYGQKYDTRQLAERVRGLEDQIDKLNAEIAVERAELATLMRPARLEKLARKFTELAPLRADQFGAIDAIPLKSVVAARVEAAAAAADGGSE